ncbi:MAG: phloretin hydrolase, partial [Selenomonadaceae bacterium]|nr:phloretin hydrolase [Selenomonadaceae bacterium]
WIGYALSDGKIICGLPEGAAVPTEVSKGLFAHNIKEFSNLAAILPKVYEENKDNF